MKSGKIIIENKVLETLLAITASEQERGLMEQKWPPPIMSFVYSQPQINKFWMYRTPSPLDIVFCKRGQIFNICHGKPHSTEIIGDDTFSDLIVELPYGTCEKMAIKIGDNIRLITEDLDNQNIYSKVLK